MAGHTPQEVLKKAILDEVSLSIVDPLVTTDANWRIFLNNLPDEDNVLGLFASNGIKFAREISTTNVPHMRSGFQIIVRSAAGDSGNVAYAKLESIETWMATVSQQQVIITPAIYNLQCLIQNGPILTLGPEVESRRLRYSLNGLIVI